MNPLGKLLSFLIVLVLISLGVWFFVKSRAGVGMLQPSASAPSGQGSTNIQVQKTNVSAAPAGFPSDIPVETNNITESYRLAYKDKGIVQYTVSYTSLKSRDALWSVYSDYMNANGFVIDKSASSRSLGQISGVKGTNTLSVIISDHSGLALVQINYLER